MTAPLDRLAAVPASRVATAARVLLVAGVLAFLLRGADRPADPTVAMAGEGALASFGEIAVRVARGDGSVSEWCALLAATSAARRQGLMGRRDLAGYDAMVFRFDAPTTSPFYMYRTVLPLSIAFVGGDGRVVSTADMAPCESDDPAACPTHGPRAPYRHAVETLAGGLPGLGLVEGAAVTFGEERCPT